MINKPSFILAIGTSISFLASTVICFFVGIVNDMFIAIRLEDRRKVLPPPTEREVDIYLAGGDD